jgi:hypothetical protein
MTWAHTGADPSMHPMFCCESKDAHRFVTIIVVVVVFLVMEKLKLSTVT